MNIRKIVFENRFLYKLLKIKHKISTHFQSKKCKISNKGKARLKKDCIGVGNTVQIGIGSTLHDTSIHIRGNNNQLIIGENVQVGPDCSFWMEGNNITIYIGSKTTFTSRVHICAQEDGTKVRIGEDCMFANTIAIRTSDSHPIYDLSSKERINKAKDVFIGDHVWVAPNVKIMKGVTIANGAIIGSDTMVTKPVDANCLAVGYPAKTVKTNIEWTREKPF